MASIPTTEELPFYFVSVQEFCRITGWAQSTVSQMIADGLLGNAAMRSNDTSNGTWRIHLLTALQARGLSDKAIEAIRKHLESKQIAPPAPTLCYGFTITGGIPHQLLSFPPTVAPRRSSEALTT